MPVDILSSHLLIREWLNGSLLPLTLNLSIVIGIYLSQSFLDSRRFGRRFMNTPGIHTALVLFWVFFAESARAGSVWFSLRMQNAGREIPPDVGNLLNVMLVMCGVILVTAVLRCTYLFTPPKVRNVIWIYSLFVTVTFVILSHLFPQFPAL